MKTIKKLNFVKLAEIAFAVIILLAPVAVFADKTSDILPPSICGSLTGVKCGGTADNTVGGILITIINWALGLAGLVAVAFLIYGGFVYIFSGGNLTKAEDGKKAVFNALIGLVIIILSYVIVRIVVGTVNSGIAG